MAKTMALLDENNIVSNVLWYSDYEPDTDTLKNIGDYPVGIGDEYRNGEWYRDGKKILSPSEEEINALKKKVEELESANTTLTECVLEMSEVVYA